MIVIGYTDPSIWYIDSICTKALNLIPILSPPLATASHLHAFHESLSDITGYDSSFDMYCTYLEGVLRKIMWSTFFS